MSCISVEERRFFDETFLMLGMLEMSPFNPVTVHQT